MVWHELRRYGFALLTVGAAVLFARALDRYISPHVSPPYFLAVMLSAAYAGAGPGLLATVLSSLAIAWFDLGTSHNLDLGLDDLIRLAIFVATALIISSISAARKAAEAELRVALDELSALDRSKDEFIATVSHELRTPLTGILGWLRILNVKDLDPETRTLALQSVEQSASTLALLVDDLLDASRIVLGKLHVEKQPLFLRDVIRDAINVVRPAANARRIAILTSGIEEPLVVDGDRERLQQVIWNLLTNAVKFSPEGGTVRVRTLAMRGEAIVEVADDGEGIDEELLRHVFDRFTQGRDSIRKGGLGLGLSIARHIIDLHEGSLAAHSAGRNRGSTFTVRLPLFRDRTRSAPYPPEGTGTAPHSA